MTAPFSAGCMRMSVQRTLASMLHLLIPRDMTQHPSCAQYIGKCTRGMETSHSYDESRLYCSGLIVGFVVRLHLFWDDSRIRVERRLLVVTDPTEHCAG